MADAEPLQIGFRVVPPPNAEDGTPLKFTKAAFCGAYCYALLGGHSIYRIKLHGALWELVWSVPEDRRRLGQLLIAAAPLIFTVPENAAMQVVDVYATRFKLILVILCAVTEALPGARRFLIRQVVTLVPPDGNVPFTEPEIMLGLDNVLWSTKIFVDDDVVYVYLPNTELAALPPFVYVYNSSCTPQRFHTFIHDQVTVAIPAVPGVVPAAETIPVPGWARPFNPTVIELHIAARGLVTIDGPDRRTTIVYRLSSGHMYRVQGDLRGARFISLGADVAPIDGGAAVFRNEDVDELGTLLGSDINTDDVQFKNGRFIVSETFVDRPRITASRAGFVYRISEGDVTESGHFLCSFCSLFDAVALFEVERPETTLRLLGLSLPGPALAATGKFLLGPMT